MVDITEMAVTHHVTLLGVSELDALLDTLDRNYEFLPREVQVACKALADTVPVDPDEPLL